MFAADRRTGQTLGHILRMAADSSVLIKVDTKMDKLSSINTFRQVVESGSFVAAAERLEVSTATVSKRIIHIEQRLGVRLINRNSRKFSLTDCGRLYFERCKTILEDLQAAELELGSPDRAPRGTLRITSPSFTAAGRLAHLLAEYGRRYPDVLVDVSFEDRLADLVEEGYDIALRLSSKADTLPQGLIARPIRPETFYLAASRGYVDRRGLPRSPADLPAHDFVTLHDLAWVPPAQARVALCCRSTAGVTTAIAAGIGIGPVPGFVLEDPLFKDVLVRVLPEFPLQSATLYVVYTRRKLMPPKVSTFVDFILQSLSPLAGKQVLRSDRRQPAALRSAQPAPASAVLRAPERESAAGALT